MRGKTSASETPASQALRMRFQDASPVNKRQFYGSPHAEGFAKRNVSKHEGGANGVESFTLCYSRTKPQIRLAVNRCTRRQASSSNAVEAA